MKAPPIARGPGPVPFRIVLVVLAGLYFGVLLKHPKKIRFNKNDHGAHKAFVGVIDAIAHLSECTGLFPEAAKIGTGGDTWAPGGRDFRFEAYSCDRKKWEPLDTRPYFPIQADDKESRLPRILHYYFEEADDKKMRQTLMSALDDYLYDLHDGDADGVAGPIGGFRMSSVRRLYGQPGDPVERYSNDPLAPIPSDARIEYNTPRGKRFDGKPGMKARCHVERIDFDTPEVDVAPTTTPDPWAQP